ncbi:MAG TPA: STAS domain-containing protein [Actinophytocola sp.]|uniref:STAS domain-containing protein n=1 Tax=Actinophytocola sp. TaxID=1872138 RepID=UPI002DDCE822|nr:STAS domain-containing protein [Actinophytocola sp.]HEV2778047.1 STAS domain-containing protein [Actinophytocola sp.]
MLDPAERRQAAAQELFDVRGSDVDGVVIVSVAGDVDTSSAVHLQEVIAGSVERAAERVVIDLTAVTFFGSTGLAVLAEAASHAAQRNLALRVVANHPTVARPIRVTGLDSVLVVCASVEEALA